MLNTPYDALILKMDIIIIIKMKVLRSMFDFA